MKPYHYRFEKVLTFREQTAETGDEMKHSIQAFEAVATKLYDLLKKKEDILLEQHEKMKTGFSVNGIHHYARYIDSLEKRIAIVQQEVMQARSKMNWFENKLLEKSLEVKKFEEMKDKDREHHRAEMGNLRSNPA